MATEDEGYQLIEDLQRAIAEQRATAGKRNNLPSQDIPAVSPENGEGPADPKSRHQKVTIPFGTPSAKS